MIALFVLLAICAVSVNAACDAAGLKTCTDAYTKCVTDATMGGGSTAASKACDCYGAYIKCYGSAGCPAASVQAIIDACKGNSVCTAAQCASSSTVSMSLVAVVAALVARFY